MPRAFAAPTASNVTAAASPPSWAMTATRLRSPQIASCSRAAARNVSPAESSTDRPCCCSHFASLPIDVVFPAPLTPAIMIDERPCGLDAQRLLERPDQVEQRRAQQRARVRVAARLAVALLQVLEQMAGRVDADVGGEQRLLELVERLLVEDAVAEDAGQRARRACRATR